MVMRQPGIEARTGEQTGEALKMERPPPRPAEI
jgi:hypothetical protein